MTHKEVSDIAIRWFNEQERYNGWRMIPNRSGEAVFVSDKKTEAHVPYGVPPSGGGSDFMLFGNSDGRFTCEFLEVKTIGYATVSKKQRYWLGVMSGMGANCWIFYEKKTTPFFGVARFGDYKVGMVKG